jgi:hypothetical protein
MIQPVGSNLTHVIYTILMWATTITASETDSCSTIKRRNKLDNKRVERLKREAKKLLLKALPYTLRDCLLLFMAVKEGFEPSIRC